jgi:hypothetical protein
MSSAPEPRALQDASAVVAAVAEGGLLLFSDERRHNAIEVLTGEFPRGSWWKHPEASAINRQLERVAEHPDVLLAKLVAGKATFVHRALWPALLAVVVAREPWQMDGLSPGAAQLLAALDAGTLMPSEAAPLSKTAAKELEGRLLAQATSIHGRDGKREMTLQSWGDWAARVGCTPAPSVAESKQALEQAAARLGGPPAVMPWTAAAAESAPG